MTDEIMMTNTNTTTYKPVCKYALDLTTLFQRNEEKN